MKNSRCIFALLMLGGCGELAGQVSMPPTVATRSVPSVLAPPTTAAGPQQVGDELIQRALANLERRRSISARLRHRVLLYDHELVGNGAYLQVGQGAEQCWRLQLRLQSGQSASTLTQICDAQYLWIYQQSSDQTTLHRADARRVRDALQKAGHIDAHTGRSTFPLGGLPKLVAGLRHNFDCVQVQPGQIEGRPTWELTCRWKPQQLAAIDFENMLHLPEQVLVSLLQENDFPYRIIYQRTSPQQGRAGQGSAPSAMVNIVTLEFFDVMFDAAIDPREFAFQPTGLEVLDTTEALMQSLGLAPKLQ